MPTPTPELGLQKALDADDTADYLDTSLANSLTTLDSLFNNVSGHTHGGVHQGGPISSIPPSAIPAGSITSTMITDGTIQSLDLADGAVGPTQLANGAVGPTQLAAGAASSNVGTLGGVLTGTLPNPGMAAGVVGTSQIAASVTLTTPTLSGGNINNNTLASCVVNSSTINSPTITGTISGTPAIPGIAGNVTFTGDITVNANYRFSSQGGNVALGVYADGLHVGNATLIVAGNVWVQGVAGSYAFTGPNSPSPAGQGWCNSWISASSADFKDNITPIGDPLAIVLNPELHGVEYDHTWHLDALQGVREAVGGTSHHVGFVADYWLPHVPEIVAVDKNGKPEGMDYSRVGAIVFEALKEYVLRTDARLAVLEGPTA